MNHSHQALTARGLVARAPRLVALAALTLAATAHAGYFQWDMVELPAHTGATCGNGTPYRFFVNRTPFTTKTVVIFEGGGACYDKNACLYKDGFLGAINPNGIPTDYMTRVVPSLPNEAGTALGVFNSALLGYITPLASRVNTSRVQTQSWNIVYAPYCTGDVYTGNRVKLYPDPDGGTPLAYHHRGNLNTEAMARWLGANMRRPQNLLVTGFSAGGAGATANYAYVREQMRPQRSALLADSGPLFNVPRGASPTAAPSAPLHATIREAWGLDGPNGLIARMLARYPLAGGDADNLGSLNTAIARVFPQDRIGYTLTRSDALFAAFAYDNFHPDIRAGSTIAERDARRLSLWRQEVDAWVAPMRGERNIGVYLPYRRDGVLKSHTTTMLTFDDTGIAEAGTRSVTDFIDNLIDGQGPVMRAEGAPSEPDSSWWSSLNRRLQDSVFESLGL